jgi:primosomal protein N' (replication factor Y)
MEAAARGKSSIILVPEISLTAQVISEFKRDFDRVIVTHSRQTEAERHAVWLAALMAEQPTVVIGPRSALFMPLANLGLIVVDECHEPSYKQEKAPRYNALRAASVLSQKTGARLILGSATPLIVDYFAAKKLHRPIIKMTQLARRDAVKPEIKVVDLTAREARARHPLFSRPLLEAMTKNLESGRQIMLFHNRRGTAPLTLCENCGWSAMCPRCFTPLTLHADKHQLRCHICGHHETPPTACPACQQAGIIHRGIGTKLIEAEVAKLFPAAKIQRFDGDNPKGQAVHDLFDQLKSGQIDIIIGTQTIAKGLDLPNLALVGIVQADAGLMLPDFSSSERTFQLIAQATGRVGRSQTPTTAIIQTYQPEHPAVQFGVAQNYDGFYDYEIKNRARGHFPPFAQLLKLTNSYKTEKAAVNSAQKMATAIANEVKQSNNDSDQTLFILGPTPAFYERQRDNYRWQIVVRSPNRTKLLKIAAKIPLKNWQVELDPGSLI